jgi:hypothetical protein
MQAINFKRLFYGTCIRSKLKPSGVESAFDGFLSGVIKRM